MLVAVTTPGEALLSVSPVPITVVAVVSVQDAGLLSVSAIVIADRAATGAPA